MSLGITEILLILVVYSEEKEFPKLQEHWAELLMNTKKQKVLLKKKPTS